MKTRTMRGIAAALSTVAILASTASQASATDTKSATKRSDLAASPAAYVHYLRHSQEAGAAETLKAFKKLTPTDQSNFIGYLHDPSTLETFFDKAADQDIDLFADSRNISSTTSLHSGDVSIVQERKVSGLSNADHGHLSSGDHTATYTTYVKYFGVKVIKLNLSVNFHSNGRDITKVNSTEATKRNLSGVISISHGRPKKGLSNWQHCRINPHRCTQGHHATASVIWTGEVGFRGSVFQVDKKQWMKASIDGKVFDYYLHNV